MDLCSPGYALALSDDTRWWLTADQSLACWMDRFASVMSLGTSPLAGCAKLVFCREATPAAGSAVVIDIIPPAFRNSGSDAHTHPWLSQPTILRDDFDAADRICLIRHSGSDYLGYVSMGLSLQVIYERSMMKGGLPFHATVLEWNGMGVLLAAPSGTGKTTCYHRVPDYWNRLCDDETLVVVDHENGYRAHPFPTWSNYLFKRRPQTWAAQQSVPVSAIFFLEQAASDKLEPLGPGKAALFASESAMEVCWRYWFGIAQRDLGRCRRKVFDNACTFVAQIPAFLLHVSLSGPFWIKLEETLSQLPRPQACARKTRISSCAEANTSAIGINLEPSRTL